jgi:hypothetical protein
MSSALRESLLTFPIPTSPVAAAALDLPPRRARDVLVRCPELLRRSTMAVHERFKVRVSDVVIYEYMYPNHL